MSKPKTRAARDFFAQKLAYLTGPRELKGMLDRQEAVTVVDVRRPADFRTGHVPGAVNLPQGRWHTLEGVSRDRTAIVHGYDQTCQLGAAAAVELARHGIAVVEMEGGFEAWRRCGLPVEVSPDA